MPEPSVGRIAAKGVEIVMPKQRVLRINAKDLITALGCQDRRTGKNLTFDEALKISGKVLQLTEEGNRIKHMLNELQRQGVRLELTHDSVPEKPEHLRAKNEIPQKVLAASLIYNNAGVDFSNRSGLYEGRQMDFTSVQATPENDNLIELDISDPKQVRSQISSVNEKFEKAEEESKAKDNVGQYITKDKLDEILKKYDKQKGWLRKKFFGRDSASETVKQLKALRNQSKGYIFKDDVLKILNEVDQKGLHARSSKVGSYADLMNSGGKLAPTGKPSETDLVVRELSTEFSQADTLAAGATKQECISRNTLETILAEHDEATGRFGRDSTVIKALKALMKNTSGDILKDDVLKVLEKSDKKGHPRGSQFKSYVELMASGGEGAPTGKPSATDLVVGQVAAAFKEAAIKSAPDVRTHEIFPGSVK